MKTQADAEELAEMMISIGSKMGKQVRALITDMNQPLGAMSETHWSWWKS